MRLLTSIQTVSAAILLTAFPTHSLPANRPISTSLASQAPEQGSQAEAPQISSSSLAKGKRLILTDGSFHLVREYAVQGDRVRYWSVERSDWEEIPANIVDWGATRKAEAAQAARDAELKAQIHASAVAERTKDIDVDRSLEIKPALFLPDAVGFYALEDRQIRELKQSMATTKRDKRREAERILSGVPLIPSRQRLEMPGARAALRLSTAEPEFFMRPADRREPRFVLLRAQVKGGNRLLETISTHMSGEQTQRSQEMEVQTWTPASGVFRYTTNQRLEPGEYAFVELTKEGVNAYVWDFGIDARTGSNTK